jgi:hypothetical protein
MFKNLFRLAGLAGAAEERAKETGRPEDQKKADKKVEDLRSAFNDATTGKTK